MKAIQTKYHGPCNVRGSRISASDLDGNRVFMSLDPALNSDDNHKAAVVALCKKMKWTGKLYRGEIAKCSVWVWADESEALEV